ncbi:MAG: LON peptidase substrate-binding domain-containing protein, partial [Thermoanaerobaculia bacterium]|nr:LON peptidase substrate-binding domain-containing protein [Thermoanaerobaculia bacterium]
MTELIRTENEEIILPDTLPVLPLRDAVLFPYIILPLSIGRERSTRAVDHALASHRMLMLVGQRDSSLQHPSYDDLYEMGTVATITRMLKLPDGRVRILVQGLARARLARLTQSEPFLEAEITTVEDIVSRPKPSELEHEALLRSVRQQLETAANLGRNVSPEVLVIVANLEDSGRLADLAASNLELKAEESQQILEELDPNRRLRRMNDILARELEVLSMQQNIASQARDEMDRSQRDYFLRQQMKAIQDELGDGDELSQEIQAWREMVVEKKMPESATEEFDKQIKRLERSHPDSAEASIIRTYLDWLAGLPWGTESEDDLDIANARRVLDEDHY